MQIGPDTVVSFHYTLREEAGDELETSRGGEGVGGARGSEPAGGWWSVFDIYYLHAVERVGVMYGIEKIAGHDWYRGASAILIEEQKPDGCWSGRSGLSTIDTSMALLFLKKRIPIIETR